MGSAERDRKTEMWFKRETGSEQEGGRPQNLPRQLLRPPCTNQGKGKKDERGCEHV